MRVVAIVILLASSLMAAGQRENARPITRQPIIDVHRHASWPGVDDDGERKALLADMDAEGIVLSLLHINGAGGRRGVAAASAGKVYRRAGDAVPANSRQGAVLSMLCR